MVKPLLMAGGLLAGALLGAAALSFYQGSSADDRASISGELVIFHAGSLAVPFREFTALFKERHPGVTILAESAGSRDCARKICDLGRSCDVLASADYKVVDNLLMPEHVDFNIRFAANEMVIAYTGRSNAADQIGRDNWYEVLLQDDVRFGRSDPNRDPCGYRTVMLFQLAENHYGVADLAAKLEEKGGRRFIRPKETDLLALLEVGEIDYLFIYRSVATQHGLEILQLPEEVNLGSPALSELYQMATVPVTGKRPGDFITRRGAPIVYSVTVPKNAGNRSLAEDYVALLLSPAGRAIMERNGHPAIAPARADGFDRLPTSLKAFCE